MKIFYINENQDKGKQRFPSLQSKIVDFQGYNTAVTFKVKIRDLNK